MTKLRRRHEAASEALAQNPPSQDAWDALRPRRLLFAQDFEADGDWDGEILAEGAGPEHGRCLSGHEKNRYFARHARVGIRDDHARATTTTWIRFRYFLSKPTPLEVMLFDLTQKDNYAATIPEPVAGEWTEATLKVTGVFRRKDGTDACMEAGDAIDDIFFNAGRVGDRDIRLLLDDVELLGLD